MCNTYCFIATVAPRKILMAYHLNEVLKNASDSMRAEVVIFFCDADHISRSPFPKCYEVKLLKL